MLIYALFILLEINRIFDSGNRKMSIILPKKIVKGESWKLEIKRIKQNREEATCVACDYIYIYVYSSPPQGKIKEEIQIGSFGYIS